MSDGVDHAIRDALARYLDGQAKLDGFQVEFVELTWEAERTASPAVRDLVATVELRLAEFTNGHLNENELRSALTGVLNHARVDAAGTHMVITTSSAVTQSAAADRSHVTASVSVADR